MKQSSATKVAKIKEAMVYDLGASPLEIFAVQCNPSYSFNGRRSSLVSVK